MREEVANRKTRLFTHCFCSEFATSRRSSITALATQRSVAAGVPANDVKHSAANTPKYRAHETAIRSHSSASTYINKLTLFNDKPYRAIFCTGIDVDSLRAGSTGGRRGRGKKPPKNTRARPKGKNTTKMSNVIFNYAPRNFRSAIRR